jgi:hypothetical protein
MCPQHIGYDPSRAMTHGMPEPSLWSFLPNNTPPFINFSFFNFVDLTDELSWIHMLKGWIVDVLELMLCF